MSYPNLSTFSTYYELNLNLPFFWTPMIKYENYYLWFSRKDLIDLYDYYSMFVDSIMRDILLSVMVAGEVDVG